MPFDFQNLKYDRHYYIVAYYVGQEGNLDNGGLWINDHQYKPNIGILYWKNNGALTAVANKAVYTTPATACGVYLDRTTVKTMRVGANPNTIYVFSEGTTLPNIVGGRGNFVQGTQADTVIIRSDNYFYSPVRFNAAHAIFRHTFPEDTDGSRWQTITTPFQPQALMIDGEEVPLNDEANHFWIYEFYALDDQGNPMFEPVTELRGETPYIIAGDYKMAGLTLEFVAQDVTFGKTDDSKHLVSSPAYNFYGTALQTTHANIYSLNEEGTAFVWNNTTSALSPLGTYFTTSLDDGERLSEIALPAVPQSTDALDFVHVSNGESLPVYDLGGRRVADLPAGHNLRAIGLRPGIYLVGGKKIILK